MTLAEKMGICDQNKSKKKLINDYAEHSTVQGLFYIFQQRQTIIGKIFWSVLISSLMILGIYWSIRAYSDWKESPVLTTVMTTAHPIKNIDFPAITVCSQGLNQDIFLSGMIFQFLKYLQDTSLESASANAWQLTNLVYVKNISEMNTQERKILHDFSYGYFQKMGIFLKVFTPGLHFMDPITDIIWLISSKNPDMLIKSLLQTNTFSKFPKNLENFTEIYGNITLNENRVTNYTFFDKTLNPNFTAAKSKNVMTVISRFKEIFSRLNKTAAFPNLLGALWFAAMPCNDVNGLTADYDGQNSILKICKWKGVKIPCSAIFSTYPTDQGMCCSFNKRPANKIFLEQSYSSLIERLQAFEHNNSFVRRNFSEDFPDPDEPFPQAGQNKGLYVMLDAHNDLLAGWSSESDFIGFTALIDGRGSYPLVSQNGFMIKPGHINMVALTATDIDATQSLRNIQPVDRKCLFPDETSQLKFHKTYSQTNCLLECTMLYAQNQLPKLLNTTDFCIPWYLPFPYSSVPMCDPWEAVEFENIMADQIPGDQCTYCLPDCQTTIFKHSVTSLPFKECDESNIGISFLCNLEDQDSPQPRIWAEAVIDEFSNMNSKPSYISRLVSSKRQLFPSPIIFTQMQRSYKAYEKDVAVLQVYFDSPTIFKFVSQLSQNWIGFFSAIGGLLGLCLGVSIVTIFELFWLAFKIGETFWFQNRKL